MHLWVWNYSWKLGSRVKSPNVMLAESIWNVNDVVQSFIDNSEEWNCIWLRDVWSVGVKNVCVNWQMIVNPRNAEAKDLSINNPLSQEVEVWWCVEGLWWCHLDRSLMILCEWSLKFVLAPTNLSESKIHNNAAFVIFMTSLQWAEVVLFFISCCVCWIQIYIQC